MADSPAMNTRNRTGSRSRTNSPESVASQTAPSTGRRPNVRPPSRRGPRQSPNTGTSSAYGGSGRAGQATPSRVAQSVEDADALPTIEEEEGVGEAGRTTMLGRMNQNRTESAAPSAIGESPERPTRRDQENERIDRHWDRFWAMLHPWALVFFFLFFMFFAQSFAPYAISSPSTDNGTDSWFDIRIRNWGAAAQAKVHMKDVNKISEQPEQVAAELVTIGRIVTNLQHRMNVVEGTLTQHGRDLRQQVQEVVRGLDRTLTSDLWQVNFFSHNQGAVVDPYLTSPTMWRSQKGLARVYSGLTGRGAPNRPFVALQPWREAGDCWCAAPPSPKTSVRPGKGANELEQAPRAQLGIVMAHAAVPKSVVIEHIPEAGTLYPSGAPKGMELWVEIENAARRELVKEASERYYSSLLEEPGSVSRAGGGLALDRKWVRIAKFEYQLHDSNYVQSFPVNIDLAEYGVSVSKAVVRAFSNWGGDATCFYRVRLHGVAAKV